ncbi:UNVERIFIED_CONTAM: hypothetical protein HDU68_001139 [Siphonaria sp. JEL0065]|nr:hypothetical protein HDU68_001139 [Siphonaria sp. JEL0065]
MLHDTKVLHATVKIQAWLRMCIHRRSLKRVLVSVKRIQRVWRAFAEGKSTKTTFIEPISPLKNGNLTLCASNVVGVVVDTDILEKRRKQEQAAIKIQSMWKKYGQQQQFQKLKRLVNRVKSGFKLRKQRRLKEKLDMLAKIKAQKLLLLEKRRMAEEISSSQIAAAAEPNLVVNAPISPENLSGSESSSTRNTPEIVDEEVTKSDAMSQEMDHEFIVPDSPLPPPSNASIPSSSFLSLLAPPPLSSVTEPLSSASIEQPDALSPPVPWVKSPKHVSLLPQRRTTRKSIAPAPITAIPVASFGKKKTTSATSSSASLPNTNNIKTVFCHLDKMTPKEVERLTITNTNKNCGHAAVTLRVEVVNMGVVRPPSPGLEQTRQDLINNTNDPHCGTDPSRKTNIQWSQTLRQEFPLPEVVATRMATTRSESTSSQVSSLPPSSSAPSSSSCLRKTTQVLKVMEVKKEVVVVKRLEYLDDEEDGDVEGASDGGEDVEVEDLCLVAEKVANGVGSKKRGVTGGSGLSKRGPTVKGGAKKRSKIAIGASVGVGGTKKVAAGSNIAKAPASRVAIVSSKKK